MTTRAKLADWQDAILAVTPTAAAAAVGSAPADLCAPLAWPVAGSGSNAITASSSRYSCSSYLNSEGAAELALAPWAWPLSARFSVKGSGGSSSSSKGTAGAASTAAAAARADASVGAHLLRAQRPLVLASLQEMSSTAASVHRRVMIFVRTHEGVLL